MAQIRRIKGKGNRSGKRGTHPSILSVGKENGCLKVAGWLTDKWVGLRGGADLILPVYAHSVSMSTDMFMSPAPPSNRWWERFGGECTCHGVRWATPEPRGGWGPEGSRIDYPLSHP